MPKALLAKLPEKAKDIYESAWQEAQDRGYDDARAAQYAIGAVKRAGYRKDEESGIWRKMQTLQMHITKASLGKDGVMRWAATISRFALDKQGDIVTPEFIASAKKQVDQGKRPDPVVCVSHIDHGKPSDAWVAGDVTDLYVDGTVPKAKGTFRDTPLGKAAFQSIRDDWTNKVPDDGRVRVSMGFFDEGSEIIKSEGPNGETLVGRRFNAGWIKHLAMTRVPIVPETDWTLSMEEKSMSKPKSKREDAASIVGEELANELAGLAEKAETEEEELMILKQEDEEEKAPEAETEEETEEEAPEEETEEEAPEEETEEETEEEEKADVVADPADARKDQVEALLAALRRLLLPEEVADETTAVNRVALGNEGVNPPSTVERADFQEPEPAEEYTFDPQGTGDPAPEKSEYQEQVETFVDQWGAIVKAALLSSEPKEAKLDVIQRALYTFGEGVGQLVETVTPPAEESDLAGLITRAVRQAVEPVYNELAGVKAELATLRGQPTPEPVKVKSGYQPAPRAMDGRAVVIQPQLNTLGHGLQSKPRSASDLAWQSTETGPFNQR